MNTFDQTVPAKNDKIRRLYDDATLERMKHYFKLADNDELLKYIKLYGMHRHIDLLEES